MTDALAAADRAAIEGIIKGLEEAWNAADAARFASAFAEDAGFINIALVHLKAHLRVPQGAMAGEHRALPSWVLVRENGAWKIAAFHNTFVTRLPSFH